MEDTLLSNTVDLFKCNISKSRFKKFFLDKKSHAHKTYDGTD